MAINERLIHTAADAAGAGTGNQEEGLILYLDANDVDSYDGDGSVWYDIKDHEYTPATNADEHFNTIIWNGDGTSSRSFTDVGFQPDLVWVKARSSQNHTLYDSVRGVGKYLASDNSVGESTDATYGQLTSFDVDGFTATKGTDATYSFFNSSNSYYNSGYVAWCFKAGGAAVPNTDGTITSQVSANNDLGFSIVKYTGNGINSTIGHGLGVAPQLIFIKRIDASSSWSVFTPLGSNYIMFLNATDGAYSGSSLWWNNTEPTANVFTTGSYNVHNTSSAEYIAYCFASKRGVSKVGSYTGTGATNKVYTGFEPAFIIGKCSSNDVTNWWMFDNKRGDNVLYPNLNNNEDLLTNYVSFDGDGFTLSDAAFVNQSGRTYIYYAVAKNTKETSLTPDRASFTEGSVTTGAELELDANDYSGSGNWLDSSGNSNDGTISGATYVDDGNSDYFDFDGASDYISVNSSAINSATDFTIEGWFNPDNLTATDHFFSVYDLQTASDRKFFIRLSGSAGDIDFTGYDSQGQADFGLVTSNSNVRVVANQWNHIVATHINSGTVAIYINGELAGSTTYTGSINTSGSGLFHIGTLNDYIGSYDFDGKVGQVRFYSTALTPQQVQTNYDATKVYVQPSLALHLDAASFDGSTNTPSTWTDSSGNGNNGTITGATFDSELGNWLDFDGLNDEVEIPMSFGGGGSIEMWVNITDINANNAIATKYTSGTDNRSFAWYVYNSGGVGKAVFSIYYNSSGAGNAVEFDMQDYFTSGQWHHIMHTFDANNRPTVYVDGAAISELSQYNSASQNVVYSRPSVPVVLGDWDGSTNDTYDFDGKIGQFRIYDLRLTQDQIRQNYNFTKNNYPNGFDGTISGATWNPSGYFDFDGNDDEVTFSSNNMPSTGFSTSAWFNMDAFPASGSAYGVVSWGDEATGKRRSILVWNGGSGNPKAYFSGYAANIGGTTDLSIGNWYHVVVTEENGTAKVYLNGSEEASGSVTLNAYTGTTGRIGNTGSAGEDFYGSISDVKIFDKVLTAAEVTAEYNKGQFGAN